MNIYSILVASVIFSFGLGFNIGESSAKKDLYFVLSADLSRTVKGEQSIIAVTEVKFKDGVPVEIAPFKKQE